MNTIPALSLSCPPPLIRLRTTLKEDAQNLTMTASLRQEWHHPKRHSFADEEICNCMDVTLRNCTGPCWPEAGNRWPTGKTGWPATISSLHKPQWCPNSIPPPVEFLLPFHARWEWRTDKTHQATGCTKFSGQHLVLKQISISAAMSRACVAYKTSLWERKNNASHWGDDSMHWLIRSQVLENRHHHFFENLCVSKWPIKCSCKHPSRFLRTHSSLSVDFKCRQCFNLFAVTCFCLARKGYFESDLSRDGI